MGQREVSGLTQIGPRRGKGALGQFWASGEEGWGEGDWACWAGCERKRKEGVFLFMTKEFERFKRGSRRILPQI